MCLNSYVVMNCLSQFQTDVQMGCKYVAKNLVTHLSATILWLTFDREI
jgi:hypothetical protein